MTIGSLYTQSVRSAAGWGERETEREGDRRSFKERELEMENKHPKRGDIFHQHVQTVNSPKKRLSFRNADRIRTLILNQICSARNVVKPTAHRVIDKGLRSCTAQSHSYSDYSLHNGGRFKAEWKHNVRFSVKWNALTVLRRRPPLQRVLYLYHAALIRRINTQELR